MLARAQAIVSKVSNADTITHYVNAPLNVIRRLENDLRRAYPQADVNFRALSFASVIGRELSGQRVMARGFERLEVPGIEVIAAHHVTRSIDVQFVARQEDLDGAVRAQQRLVTERVGENCARRPDGEAPDVRRCARLGVRSATVPILAEAAGRGRDGCAPATAKRRPTLALAFGLPRPRGHRSPL